MSDWQTWAEQAGLAILNWGIPFALGLAFRKRVARWINTGKMRLLNDTVSMKLVSIRSYEPTPVSQCTHSVYNNIQGKITGTKLVNMYTNGIRVTLPKYGNFKVLVDKVTDQEEENDEEDEVEQAQVTRIKVTVTPESPITFGVRNVMKLSELAHDIEVILGEIERVCLKDCTISPQYSYTIIELPRVGHFLEQKTFRSEDSELGVSIIATDNQITLTVKTLSQIANATKKHMFD